MPPKPEAQHGNVNEGLAASEHVELLLKLARSPVASMRSIRRLALIRANGGRADAIITRFSSNVQDGVHILASLRHLLDRFRREHEKLNVARLGLPFDVLHDLQSAVSSRTDHQPPAVPGNVLRSGKRRVAVAHSPV